MTKTVDWGTMTMLVTTMRTTTRISARIRKNRTMGGITGTLLSWLSVGLHRRFDRDGLDDQGGAADGGHPALVAGGKGDAGHGLGVPVHAVQPGAAGGAVSDGGQDGGGAADVQVPVGGGEGPAQPGRQRPQGQQAEDAHRHKDRRLGLQAVGEQTADEGGGPAYREPYRHQVEGGGLDEHEDDGGDQPPNGLQHRYSFLAKGRGRDAVPYLYYIHFRGR